MKISSREISLLVVALVDDIFELFHSLNGFRSLVKLERFGDATVGVYILEEPVIEVIERLSKFMQWRRERGMESG